MPSFKGGQRKGVKNVINFPQNLNRLATITTATWPGREAFKVGITCHRSPDQSFFFCAPPQAPAAGSLLYCMLNLIENQKSAMPKRKKAKEQPLNDAESLTGASKDIDDIFSIKKSISLPLGYPKKGINKTTKLQSPSSRQPMSTDSYIAIIQSKVQAAKSKPPDELLPVQQDDDFADLRGFKKRLW